MSNVAAIIDRLKELQDTRLPGARRFSLEEHDLIGICIHIVDEITEGYVLVTKGWAEVASCPIYGCVDGVHYDTDGDEPEQCPFFYEKEAMLKDSTKESES